MNIATETLGAARLGSEPPLPGSGVLVESFHGFGERRGEIGREIPAADLLGDAAESRFDVGREFLERQAVAFTQRPQLCAEKVALSD